MSNSSSSFLFIHRNVCNCFTQVDYEERKKRRIKKKRGAISHDGAWVEIDSFEIHDRCVGCDACMDVLFLIQASAARLIQIKRARER
jgi:hypothetical protein